MLVVHLTFIAWSISNWWRKTITVPTEKGEPMDVREKLIQILRVPIYPHLDADPAEVVADYLLDNGVTFQKWIPASEPPKEWKDENGDAINYLICSPGIGVDIGNWIQPAKAWFCLGVPFKVTHWMPLPEAPKEDI
jgi:hypothetical protein